MLTIDARLVHNSGMGTYLRHLIPGIIGTFPETPVCLMGDRVAFGQTGLVRKPKCKVCRGQISSLFDR